MSRHIVLSAIAERPFDDVCWILGRHAEEMFGEANEAAVEAVVDLVAESRHRVPHFDRRVKPAVQVRGLDRSGPNQLSLTLGWAGDPNRRFLPNVEATVLCSPVAGHRASTSIKVAATHTPSSATSRHNLAPLVRRILKGTLSKLLARLVEELEDYEESVFA